MKLSITPILALGLIALALAPEAALADGKRKNTCIKGDIFVDLSGGAFPIQGKSTLCLNRKGINGSIRAKDLVPGNAYTVWWIYIDDPSQCVVPGMCGPADFEGDKPLGILGRMDSGVAPRNGRRWFADTLRGFQPSSGSQVWLVINVHGPARVDDAGALARQLLTHEDLPLGGTPHMTNIVDGHLGFGNALWVFPIP